MRFVAELLSAGVSTRKAVELAVERFGISESQATTCCARYRQEARAYYEVEMAEFRASQRDRLYAHLAQARAGRVVDGVPTGPDWAAVARFEKMIAQLEGNFAAIKVEVKTGGETLARVVTGMHPEQVERATAWAAGKPLVLEGGKGAPNSAPPPGAMAEQSAGPATADRSTG